MKQYRAGPSKGEKHDTKPDDLFQWVRVIDPEQKVLHSHKCDPGSECASKEKQSRNRGNGFGNPTFKGDYPQSEKQRHRQTR
jgi:hypothetical protein